jgi:hypothetical protein
VMENIFDDLREAGSINQRLIMLESALQQHSNNAPALEIPGRCMTHEYYCPILQRYMLYPGLGSTEY